MRLALNGTARTMAQVNRTTVQRAIEEWGPISRADLARRLTLSGATVTRVVAALLAEGIAVEGRQGESRGGRRPILLRIAPRGSVVIAADVGGTKIATGIVSQAGTFLYERAVATHPPGHTPFAVLIGEIAAARADAARQGLTVAGIGIGAPGVVHQREGTVDFAPAVNWHAFALRDAVMDATGLPVFIENDANLAALGEYAYGAGQGEECLVVLVVGTAVGGGLVLNGRLHRGVCGAAGEVGYFLPDCRALDTPHPDFGALESAVAGAGIVGRVRGRLEAGEPSALPAHDGAPLTARAVFDAAAAGDALAGAVVAETADLLALVIGAYATILNPGTVVIGGGIGRRADLLIPRIRERLAGRVPFVPVLVGSALHERAVLFGATAFAARSLAGGVSMVGTEP